MTIINKHHLWKAISHLKPKDTTKSRAVKAILTAILLLSALGIAVCFSSCREEPVDTITKNKEMLLKTFNDMSEITAVNLAEKFDYFSIKEIKEITLNGKYSNRDGASFYLIDSNGDTYFVTLDSLYTLGILCADSPSGEKIYVTLGNGASENPDYINPAYKDDISEEPTASSEER